MDGRRKERSIWAGIRKKREKEKRLRRREGKVTAPVVIKQTSQNRAFLARFGPSA